MFQLTSSHRKINFERLQAHLTFSQKQNASVQADNYVCFFWNNGYLTFFVLVQRIFIALQMPGTRCRIPDSHLCIFRKNLSEFLCSRCPFQALGNGSLCSHEQSVP